MLLAKEETVLQDMTDKLTEIKSCYGMEMNVEKLKQTSPIQVMVKQSRFRPGVAQRLPGG